MGRYPRRQTGSRKQNNLPYSIPGDHPKIHEMLRNAILKNTITPYKLVVQYKGHKYSLIAHMGSDHIFGPRFDIKNNKGNDTCVWLGFEIGSGQITKAKLDSLFYTIDDKCQECPLRLIGHNQSCHDVRWGEILMKVLDHVCACVFYHNRSSTIELEDASSISIGSSNVSLKTLYGLKYGHRYYSKYGYIPKNFNDAEFADAIKENIEFSNTNASEIEFGVGDFSMIAPKGSTVKDTIPYLLNLLEHEQMTRSTRDILNDITDEMTLGEREMHKTIKSGMTFSAPNPQNGYKRDWIPIEQVIVSITPMM